MLVSLYTCRVSDKPAHLLSLTSAFTPHKQKLVLHDSLGMLSFEVIVAHMLTQC